MGLIDSASFHEGGLANATSILQMAGKVMGSNVKTFSIQYLLDEKANLVWEASASGYEYGAIERVRIFAIKLNVRVFCLAIVVRNLFVRR